jgi:hypothetical protein
MERLEVIKRIRCKELKGKILPNIVKTYRKEKDPG